MEAQALLQISNDLMQSQLTRICSDLTDEQVGYGHEAVDERGIGNIVSHLYWSVVNRSRAVAGMERAQPPEPPKTAAALLAFIEDAHRQATENIGKISDEQLLAVVKLPFGEFPGCVAMA